VLALTNAPLMEAPAYDVCLLEFQAYCGEACIGAIVCKLDLHKKMARRGYIAMLAVDNLYRRHQIGRKNQYMKNYMFCIYICNLRN
jgi:ribosomal protein S18 acetylase RimI-like enzyme